MLGYLNKSKPNTWILLCPNIPKPLHGLAPRVVKGQAWWDQVRHEAYELCNFHCAACGVHKSKALYHQWLEAHEVYIYDYVNCRLIYQLAVPLCHACHNYIHDGRMIMMVRAGKMEKEKYEAIVKRGDSLIRQHKPTMPPGLIIARETPSTDERWLLWRMVIDGKEYGPNHESLEAWKNYYAVQC